MEGLKHVEDKNQKSYSIESIDGFDVVENLTSSQEDRKLILEIFRGDYHFRTQVLGRIQSLKNGNKQRFFVKVKEWPKIKEHIDFNKGKTLKDPISIYYREDFKTHDTRYAKIGILNEIILSPKIKEIINSNDVQELVKQYGFSGIRFAEPIVAFADKGYLNI